jgi:uncharacterized protein YndB with AHSA1/START domain
MTDHATQVYTIVVKATPEAVWRAIVDPEQTRRYFHRARITVTPGHYDSRGPGGEVWGDAPVSEWDPPRRLSHGWDSLYDDGLAAEPTSRVTWEVEDAGDGTVRLTVTHDRLEGSPKTAAAVSGWGWTGVLSGLKTLLETGEPMR